MKSEAYPPLTSPCSSTVRPSLSSSVESYSVCLFRSFVSLFSPFLSLSISLLVSFRISRLSLFVARRKEEERMCIILLRIGHKVKCGQHKDRPARSVSVRHRKSDFSSFSLFSVDIIETSGVWLAFPSFFNFLSTTRQRSFFGYRFIVIKKKEEKSRPTCTNRIDPK